MKRSLQNYGISVPFFGTFSGLVDPVVGNRPVTINANFLKRNLNANETKWPPTPQGAEAYIRGAFTASGGLASGGAATLLKIHCPKGAGGWASGGAATTSYTPGTSLWQYVGSGGATIGGAAGFLKIKIPLASGGWSSGGAALHARTKTFLPLGGIQSGGNATHSRTKTFLPSGGLQSEGSASLAKWKVFLASGGCVLDGSGQTIWEPYPITYPYIGAGGIEFEGYAQTGQLRTYAYTGSGGFGAGSNPATVQSSSGKTLKRISSNFYLEL